MSKNPFDVKVIEIDKDKLTFHFINIEDYDDIFKDYIESKLIPIYDSTFDATDTLLVKTQIKEWFENKKDDENKKAGFVAEFICNLYINYLNFEQHFLFKNLEEENAMKKGFDGVYKLDNEMWLFESKSSLSTTTGVNHNSNIGEAYRDIRDKLDGSKGLNPWGNAIHHAQIADIENNKTLIQSLKKFRELFIKKEYENVKNYNVIPSSTIFLENSWTTIDNDDLKEKLKKLIINSKYEYKKMNVICIMPLKIRTTN